jgi:hypothetical protein
MASSFKVPKIKKLGEERPKFVRKASQQISLLKFRSEDLIEEESSMDSSINTAGLLNLEVERKSYLSHIKNLRLAHKIQIKNEKFLTTTKLEETVTQKLKAYEEAISNVFKRFADHFNFLNDKIDHQNRYIQKITKFISKYEQNMLIHLITDGVNVLEKPEYVEDK